ncbi:DUF808 domain-containing protein [Edwardsiella ictaluri]|nr:DUF808 domain-containing protein [Edwardsiella ictaluri]BEI03244.1 DUF808 domain-containing protein [Edwardsiella ictaluri]BEI06705.1 DUF808 domain-containing protein [Edwardsiella ictaluri]BEI10170.1 DUF808 domain-containing protein [Edwardsiella ictaluri]BEI13649.1 DUF808 domain-containing protein [Edwardsiella ictaluri]
MALSTQQVSGVNADRELPVVWAVARGSLLNKAILVPLALLISALVPWLITPLLMLGGVFLCNEGAEKLAHQWLQRGYDPQHAEPSLPDDIQAYEREKVKGTIHTDFILSAEIVAITLGTVASAGFVQQVLVLCGIALVMTLGVYGLVGLIVKLDDAGLWLRARSGILARSLGRALLNAAPWLMRLLSVVGTAAMFMVGGGIVVHGLPGLYHGIAALSPSAVGLPSVGVLLGDIGPSLLNMLFGILLGGLWVSLILGVRRLLRR